MRRLEDLNISESHQQKFYNQIKKNPQPYLQKATRTQIIEFIYQLQQQHERLSKAILEENPQMVFKEMIQKANSIQLNQKLVDIYERSIQSFDIEITDKMSKIQSLKALNQNLMIEIDKLQDQYHIDQKELIQIQKQRHRLQLNQLMRRERRQRMDISGLLSNLYTEAKIILGSD